MRKIKVLGFDGWTQGVHHYTRLLGAFAERNIELSLVHLGSWGDEPGRIKAEEINGMSVRDISFFKGLDLDEILETEQPDLVLFLSTETFAHRAFQRYCQKSGIPTIYLYHGMCSVFHVDGKTEILRSSLFGRVRFVFNQAKKSILHTFPAYARSLWKTSASMGEWVRFGSDILCRIRSKTIFVPADDAIPTKCCVFISADIKDAVMRFRFERNDVAVVGNPDLIAFGISATDIGSLLAEDMSKNDTVMYIDAGLASLGLNFNSVTEYANYLIDIDRQLKIMQRRLIVKIKPHPPTYKATLTKLLGKEGIFVVDNKDFLNRLKRCCACISEPSTLGLIPALLGMRVFLAKCGALSCLLYGTVFTSYPRAEYLEDIRQINELLLAPRSACEPHRVSSWINENSGPMPAEEMPMRVAQVVLDTLHAESDNSISFATKTAVIDHF